jgi:hypothetical protein
MARIHLIALAGIASFAGQPLGAASPATADRAAEYDVRLLVHDGGAAPSAPRLLVRAGHPATFMIANGRYSLQVTATPGAGNRVAVASHITTWLPDGLHNDTSTVSLAADGAMNTILSPHTDPGSGAVRGMRIEVSVQPAD